MMLHAAARKGLSLIFALATLCLLAACGGGGKSFTVVGNITGIPPQRVRLQELRVNDTIIITDSATIGADGKFELHAEATEAGLYQVIFEQGKYVLLSADGRNINVSGAWATLSNGNATITGSPATTELSGFLNGIEKRLADVRTMGIVLDSAQGRGDTAMLARAQADARNVQVGITQFVEAYADTTKYLPNAFFAAKVLNRSAEGEFLNDFAAGLEKRFPGQKQAAEIAAAFRKTTEPTPAQPAQPEQPEQPFTGDPLAGAQAPDISAQTPDGKTVSLASLRGKYVLLDFWASWCTPCRAENPNVVKAWNKYKGKNFTILGVSLDDSKDSWVKAIEKDGLTWTHISDLKRWESVPARIYNVQGIPANFLIDPAGKIVSTNLRGAELDARLAELLR